MYISQTLTSNQSFHVQILNNTANDRLRQQVGSRQGQHDTRSDTAQCAEKVDAVLVARKRGFTSDNELWGISKWRRSETALTMVIPRLAISRAT